MSGTTGTIPLNTVVADQLITAAERNAELENIGDLMDASGCGGHSDTDSDAQIQTAPFPGSVLSNATSIAGELERIRYQLAQILGTDFWYKPAATNLTDVGNVIVPVGGVIDYPTNTAPNTSWHLADGTALSRAAYPALNSLLSAAGYPFGNGNGTTTFNIPDYRDRMSIGAGSTYAAGATGGAATANLAHTHTVASHTHSISASGTHTHSTPNHQHTMDSSAVIDANSSHINDYITDSSGTIGSGTLGRRTSGLTTHINALRGQTQNSGSGTSGADGDHSHGGSSGAATPATDSQLSASQSILNPYLGMFKMIRVL